eukprot:7067803-Lingulodinium_polyedra.AAC.1
MSGPPSRRQSPKWSARLAQLSRRARRGWLEVPQGLAGRCVDAEVPRGRGGDVAKRSARW